MIAKFLSWRIFPKPALFLGLFISLLMKSVEAFVFLFGGFANDQKTSLRIGIVDECMANARA